MNTPHPARLRRGSGGLARRVLVGALWAVLLPHPQIARAQTPQPPLQLTWVDRTGKVIETVGPGGVYRGPDLAPDGKQIAVHRHEEITAPGSVGTGDIVVFDAGSRSGRRLAGTGSGSVENAMPIWSPDGTRIVYGSVRNGKGGLYVTRADGSGAEELLIESETAKMPMSWSPDGKYIVYWSPGNIQWILPLTGDRKPFQLSTASTTHAQVSPDGKWVAYQLTVGRSEVVVQPFPKGTPVQVSKDGGVFPRWRGDGKELFFLSTVSSGQIMAADITVKGSRIVAGVPATLFDSGYINFGHPGGNYHVFAVARDGQRFLIPRRGISISEDQNAQTLTMFDRGGKTIGTVGERGLYNGVVFSPDRTRVAVRRNDQLKGTSDLWVMDVATGQATQITSSTREAPPGPAIWSPDGQQLAYTVARDGVQAIYRKRSNGEGPEELVYTFQGSNLNLSEWTTDGRYLIYYSPQLGGNIVFALPLSGEQKPIEIARSQFTIIHGRLSPDYRFIAYRSNESGKDQVWVRRVDFSGSNPTGGDKWQISTDGGTGPVYWREDGKEIVYLSLDRGIMGVTVRTESGFTFDPPKLLFKVPDAFQAGAGLGPQTTMTRNGERFLFIVPPTPAPPQAPPQIVVVDRSGKSIRTVGDPGRYSDPTFSPDGSRFLVRKAPETVGDAELWSIDGATGKGTLVATGQVFSMLWSRDGRHIYYVNADVARTQRVGVQAIMRKAADGTGMEEMIYQYTPGAPVDISDISPDGRFLAFDSGGVLLLLPLTGGDAASRQAIEYVREEYFAWGARFSPDGRSIAYFSDETDRPELYVRPFDPVSGKVVGQKARQMTTDGAFGPVSWRADGKELYYRRPDLATDLMMAVDVSTTPAPKAGAPKFLFRRGGQASGDGQRFLVVMPR